MRNPLPSARWALRWELRRIRTTIARLRRREGTLSFYAEAGGGASQEAEELAAALQCILSDHLVPAADALAEALRLDAHPRRVGGLGDEPEVRG